MTKFDSSSTHWDIFCTVIDNYGDIGVTWRLARQLSNDFNISVRLWVDDLNSFTHILPALDPALDSQTHQGVTIIHWQNPLVIKWQAGDVLIEAFACELPSSVTSELERLDKPPSWINLEYLSSESWVDDCHGLPSLQSNGIAKHFYFPGFSKHSGGLICETGLLDQVTQWQADKAHRAALLQKLSIEGVNESDTLISVFSYETSALTTLCELWSQSTTPVHALVPQGKSLTSIQPLFSNALLQPGDCVTLGSLSLHILPMTDQVSYDQLLWSCDFNIVRGEDSFLRAQWAKRPFIWHIYPQENDAHLDKLKAFFTRYSRSLDNETSHAWQQLNIGFNQQDNQTVAAQWQKLHLKYPQLTSHATKWPVEAINDADLATRLVQFVKKG
ncbi:elongation factor P maturation arginine rhamnosyltransferase EarP [Shewanella sp. UCD-KL12]|uniref:elongation factor P maturation arginine rhamnosyltransferase EarP n=1 Tax=Shewanella sp. UCD-KL12 TaxID=1917163 RepID=UPI0009708D73|nr:elongation factor P maturation arginine rhamnosyltransferase EarP [Shewanella sp. UCD-KL12]